MSTDHVTLSDLYGASDRSAAKGEWAAKRLMARHLRREHGWGIRRINLELGMSDAEVKRAVGEDR